MIQPRSLYGVVGVVIVAITLAFALNGRRSESKETSDAHLPAVVAYERLPLRFNQHLERTHAHLRSRPNDIDGARELARLYHANGLYREARECYRFIGASAAGLDPRDHYYLADIAQNENNLTATETELRAVIEAEPDYLPARLALANTLFKIGDEGAAEREYSAALTIAPDQPQASLGLARIELQNGDDEAALTRLEELMAVHPESAAAASLFAQVLERLGQTDRAVAVAQMSLQKPERPPADPWMAELMTHCYDIQRLSITFEEYFKTGRMDEALPLLERLSELDPDSPITKIFSGFSHARALRHIAAVREYYEALAKGGDPEKICPPLVHSLLELGKDTEAESLLKDYSTRMPESIPIAKAYSEVATRRGDDGLVRTLLTKILDKEPYHYQQNMSLAKILWSAGEREQAAKCLQRVATVYASDVPSRALLGEYYLGKSDPMSAIKFLEEAYAHVAANTPAQAGLTALLGVAHLQAGHGEIESGRLPEAAAHYEKAIHFTPTDPEAYAAKANVCVQLKNFTLAAGALEKLASLLPDNPTIYLSLGDVLYQGGEKTEAGRQWQKALLLTSNADIELRNALGERLDGRINDETFR